MWEYLEPHPEIAIDKAIEHTVANYSVADWVSVAYLVPIGLIYTTRN